MGQSTLIDISRHVGRPAGIGWYVGWSVNIDWKAGLLVGQSAGVDGQVCWSFIQLGYIVRYFGWSVNPDR